MRRKSLELSLLSLILAATVLTGCFGSETPTPRPTPTPTPGPTFFENISRAVESIPEFVREAIRTLAILGILGEMFLLSRQIASLPVKPETQKVSKYYAIYLGVAVSLLVVILDIVLAPIQSPDDSSTSVWLYIISGLATGVGLMLGIDRFLRTRVVSIFVFILSSTSLSGLYLYFFAQVFKTEILVLSTSVLVGALAYVVFWNPGVIKSLYPSKPPYPTGPTAQTPSPTPEIPKPATSPTDPQVDSRKRIKQLIQLFDEQEVSGSLFGQDNPVVLYPFKTIIVKGEANWTWPGSMVLAQMMGTSSESVAQKHPKTSQALSEHLLAQKHLDIWATNPLHEWSVEKNQSIKTLFVAITLEVQRTLGLWGDELKQLAKVADNSTVWVVVMSEFPSNARKRLQQLGFLTSSLADIESLEKILSSPIE